MAAQPLRQSHRREPSRWPSGSNILRRMSRLRIVVVRSQGQLVAALPLLGRGPRPIQVGVLPGNCWSSAGALLVDPTAEPACGSWIAWSAVCDSLAWPLLRLDAACRQSLAWQQFAFALERAGMAALTRPRCRVDQIDVVGDWSVLSGRSQPQSSTADPPPDRRVGTDAQLCVLDRLAPDEVAARLRQGFEIEDQGWKGRAGTSVLKNPPMFDFYLRQARHFAATGELRLVFLEYRGRPIAFEYGWQGKGTYFPLKIAYDESVSPA